MIFIEMIILNGMSITELYLNVILFDMSFQANCDHVLLYLMFKFIHLLTLGLAFTRESVLWCELLIDELLLSMYL